jgi:hypothetical protein
VARAPLLAVVALVAGVVLPSAGAVAKGEERVLVVLATSGPRPYPVADVERTAREADEFFRTSSFGQTRLHIDVTPWLPAFRTSPGCGGLTNESFEAVVAPARVAADRAGYHAARYDDAIYAIADVRCAFHGETWGNEVMLTTQPTLQLAVHELGHTLGLGHAQSSNCPVNPLRCARDGTGDTLSPMGRGTVDFSVYEKVTLGWIPAQTRITAPGTYVLATPTVRTKLRQALIVETFEGAWWVEYRSHPFRGLVVRFVEQDVPRSPFAPASILITNPTKAGRPWIARGESYRLPGSFRVTLLRAGTAQAQVRLR